MIEFTWNSWQLWAILAVIILLVLYKLAPSYILGLFAAALADGSFDLEELSSIVIKILAELAENATKADDLELEDEPDVIVSEDSSDEYVTDSE